MWGGRDDSFGDGGASIELAGQRGKLFGGFVAIMGGPTEAQLRLNQRRTND